MKEGMVVESLIKYFNGGGSFVDMLSALVVFAAFIVAIEKVAKYIYDRFLVFYSNKRGKEKQDETLKEHDKEIASLTKKIEEITKQQKANVELFTTHELGVLEKLDIVSNNIQDLAIAVNGLNEQYAEFSESFNQHKEESRQNNKANESVDRALLRDRLTGGLRYFGQNVDEHGNVHISVKDHENMSTLFQEYFNRKGNGTMKQRYEQEFCNWIIDDN